MEKKQSTLKREKKERNRRSKQRDRAPGCGASRVADLEKGKKARK